MLSAGNGKVERMWLWPIALKRQVTVWICFLALCISPQSHADNDDVDLALVLAVDCSFSVDEREFRLQMQGLAAAFQQADVKAAIANGALQRIAVSVVEWSDASSQSTVMPWTVIASSGDADDFGEKLKGIKRSIGQGGTSISSALLYSANLLDEAPRSPRHVIDVSSDGRNNLGVPVSGVRDHLVAKGITINALVIRNEWPTLDVYFKNLVAGGVDHFVIPADNYEAYADAIRRKLIREITGPGIS
jgi:hypothetical protein